MKASGMFHGHSRWLLNGCVDVVTVTRDGNFRQLIERFPTLQALADALERSHSQISQLRNRSVHSVSGKQRVMGDDFARHIEAQLGLPTGWMDTPHGVAETAAWVEKYQAQRPRHSVREPRASYFDEGSWPFARVSKSRVFSLPSDDLALLEGILLGYIEAVENRHARAGSEQQ